MERTYICKIGFSLECFDNDGFFTGEWTTVEEGEVWSKSDDPFRIVGADDTIRLTRQEGATEHWIEIMQETLAYHFEPAENI